MTILPDLVQALYRGVVDVAGILSGCEKLHGRTVTVTGLVKCKGRGFHERRDKAAVLMFAPKLFSTTGGIAADSLAHLLVFCNAFAKRPGINNLLFSMNNDL